LPDWKDQLFQKINFFLMLTQQTIWLVKCMILKMLAFDSITLIALPHLRARYNETTKSGICGTYLSPLPAFFPETLLKRLRSILWSRAAETCRCNSTRRDAIGAFPSGHLPIYVLELRARVNGFFERDYDSYGRRLEDERSRDSTYWLHVNSQSRSQIYEHSPGNLAKKYFDSPKGRVCDEENARTSEVCRCNASYRYM